MPFLSFNSISYFTKPLASTPRSFNPFLSKLLPTLQQRYVESMFAIMAQALVVLSHHNKVIQHELSRLPIGLTISMMILNNPASFIVRLNQAHEFELVMPDDARNESADLTLSFKHLRLAVLVLSFQESTAQAFANERLTVDGDLAYAIRFLRVLNQLQAAILPKIIAHKAIKRYPDLSLRQKLFLASKVYWQLPYQLLR